MHFFEGGNAPWTELGDGIRRKIVGHTSQLMSVLVEFDKGAIGTPHSHEVHDQIAHVIAGSFVATIGGVERTLRVGDAFVAPHGTMHGVVALEDKSQLLDQFSPPREDYLVP